MKLLAIPLTVLTAGLMIFPALFAGGDPTPTGCINTAAIPTVLATIRTIESGGDYTARNSGSTASGAYQFLDSTWAGYGGVPHAREASAAVQDAKASEQVVGILDEHGSDVTAVPVVWYVGHVPADGAPEWDTIPYPDAGNVLTPRQYQTRWLTEYTQQTGAPADAVGGCATPGSGSVQASSDGYAIPGPADLFAVADVYAPHAEYPAWDWLIPLGTAIYAIRGGTVTTVQYWPYNWWDQGCSTNPNGCHTCGIGITIIDQDGNHWAYCHGTAVNVHEGQVVAAGAQILTSGDTGRSGAPHVHIELHTPDGQRHCLGPLLEALRQAVSGASSVGLPTRC